MPVPVTEITSTDLRREIGDIIDRVLRGERLVVMRHKRAICAIVPASDVTDPQRALFAPAPKG